MKKLLGTMLIALMAVACALQGGNMPNCHCEKCGCTAQCCKDCGADCKCDHSAAAGSQCHKAK
jgi:hypothetical protein